MRSRSVAAFQSRIRWLESVVRQTGLNLDLTNASSDGALDAQEILYTASEGAANHLRQSQNSSETFNSAGHGMHPDEHDDESQLSNQNPPPETRNELAHEIGRFAVSAGIDSRYGGPSSGYAFTKLLLANTRRKGGKSEQQLTTHRPRPSSLPDGISIAPTPLPSNLDHILHISETYFEFVNARFPILHRPSYFELVEHVHTSEKRSPMASFQVAMVLAISVTILSKRMKLPYSGEGFAATAMASLELSSIENSLQGLQCLLLLIMYTLHSSFLGLNGWYLNYQAIAAVLDLGLQRDVRAGRSVSLLEQEMRTRIFWVTYTLDRTLATTMGRPIGLRDEACDLRVRWLGACPASILNVLTSFLPTYQMTCLLKMLFRQYMRAWKMTARQYPMLSTYSSSLNSTRKLSTYFTASLEKLQDTHIQAYQIFPIGWPIWYLAFGTGGMQFRSSPLTKNISI